MGSDGGYIDPRDGKAKQGADSRRKAKRERKRRRRGRLIPMIGLIPHRPKGDDARIAVKDGLKRFHHMSSSARRWGAQRNVRWEQNSFIKRNGAYGDGWQW